jgi:geranylgeranyl reductase family protein
MAADARSFDVAVVGAGPAGCAAATALATAGRSVVLLEKSTLPRYKTCGGGILARAMRLLPPAARAAVEREFNSVALNFLGTPRNYVATRPEPVVSMTMRAQLDFLLAREAQNAGATLIENCPLKRFDSEANKVRLIGERGEIRAQFVVAADGVHSAVARAAGWPDLPALAPALEHEIYPVPEDYARFADQPRFDFNAIDAGYAWVFPKRTHLSVGILSTHRVCTNLTASLAGYLRGLGLTRLQKTERHGYVIPLAPRRGPLAQGRVLLTGDAAGLVDPVTAEGISHALLSGRLAAEAILQGEMEPVKVATHYQTLLEENILGELRAGRFLARILYRHPRLRNAAFHLNGQKLCEFVTDVAVGRRRYWDALRRPANYLKLFGG